MPDPLIAANSRFCRSFTVLQRKLKKVDVKLRQTNLSAFKDYIGLLSDLTFNNNVTNNISVTNVNLSHSLI